MGHVDPHHGGENQDRQHDPPSAQADDDYVRASTRSTPFGGGPQSRLDSTNLVQDAIPEPSHQVLVWGGVGQQLSRLQTQLMPEYPESRSDVP